MSRCCGRLRQKDIQIRWKESLANWVVKGLKSKQILDLIERSNGLVCVPRVFKETSSPWHETNATNVTTTAVKTPQKYLRLSLDSSWCTPMPRSPKKEPAQRKPGLQRAVFMTCDCQPVSPRSGAHLEKNFHMKWEHLWKLWNVGEAHEASKPTRWWRTCLTKPLFQGRNKRQASPNCCYFQR